MLLVCSSRIVVGLVAVLHRVPCEGRDVRDDPLVTEQDLRQVLIDMISIPGQAHAEGDTS